jgi:hypothetical protein
MKYIKIIGLASVVMTTLVSGTASATTVTSPKGTTYTSTIVAENEGTITLTSAFGGFGSISCTKSLLESKIETHGASVTAGGKVSKLTFEGCTGGEPTSPVATPGSLEIHTNGDVTSKSASVAVHKTLFGTCTFTTASTGTSTGTGTGTAVTGGNATLDIKATITSACGNGTLEGSYKVKTPSTVYAD